MVFESSFLIIIFTIIKKMDKWGKKNGKCDVCDEGWECERDYRTHICSNALTALTHPSLAHLFIWPLATPTTFPHALLSCSHLCYLTYYIAGRYCISQNGANFFEFLFKNFERFNFQFVMISLNTKRSVKKFHCPSVG